MFLCPGRVRWMSNNKGDNCQVINYLWMGYHVTRSGRGQIVYRGHNAPGCSDQPQSYGSTSWVYILSNIKLVARLKLI